MSISQVSIDTFKLIAAPIHSDYSAHLFSLLSPKNQLRKKYLIFVQFSYFTKN